MPSFYSQSDVARLGHRYQVYMKHTGTNRNQVLSRIQRWEPTIRQPTEVYYELGSVDPTGSASDSPEFTLAVQEYVHDCVFDRLLAGKASDATTWTLQDYINAQLLKGYLLTRDNSGNIQDEYELDQGVTSEVRYGWQMNQPIMGDYTFNFQLGKHNAAGYTVNSSWAVQDTVSPGGIRIKDARLFLGGQSAAYRMYRLQSFNLRIQWRATPVREAGNRALVGYVVEQPRSQLDFDLDAADAQPDNVLYTNVGSPVNYYDWINPVNQSLNAIRIYDPTAAEGSTVIRSWSIENLIPQQATPVLAQVRGLSTKRYSMLVAKATTAGTGGITMFSGDIV